MTSEHLVSLTLDEQLSPDEEALLELEALLGAFDDRMADTNISQAAARDRDEQIFTSIHSLLAKDENRQNLALLDTINARLAMQTCVGHEHFVEQFHTYGEKTGDKHSHIAHFGHDHSEEDEDDDQETAKKKKRLRMLRQGGWLFAILFGA